MKGFLLNLQGPMMSFADTGFGQLREAGPFPSRSAVLGIVAAALGIERGNERLLDLHRSLRIHVATVATGSLMVDYHTVLTAGYDEYDPDRLRREGVAGANPVLTDRSYHCDAHFIALLDGDDQSLLQECRMALRNPVFTGFLGRRSCVPATPLVPMNTEGETVLDALCSAVRSAYHDRQAHRRHWNREDLRSFDVFLDGVPQKGDTMLDTGCGDARIVAHSYRRDLLTALPRSYVNRPVTHVRVQLPPASTTSPTINEEMYHDAP